MDPAALRRLLDAVASGALDPASAADQLGRLDIADLGIALVDHQRSIRQGMPEAVYGPGKSAQACAAIVAELLEGGTGPVVLTRADAAQRAACTAVAGEPAATGGPGHAQTLVWRPAASRGPQPIVVTAGTADLPVADECATVLGALGLAPKLLVDCGVAGIHRLLGHMDDLRAAPAVVVVAGMEGALASVVGGLVATPVVAVPTSVGYGSSFEGLTALVAMTASCAAGVTVVGIDNGYGAAAAVARILGAASPAPPAAPSRSAR